MLTLEQTEQIKKQLILQIESVFPDEKKEIAKKQISNMNPQELEEFIKKNNLATQKNQENPFRLIISGKIQSYLVEENKYALAVLEINPISKGHTIIIPKKQIAERKKIPKYLTSFANKVAKKIKTRLKPTNISVSISNILGETIINILPIYQDETLESARSQANPEELLEIQKTLKKKEGGEKKISKKKGVEKIDEKTWLPKRIP